MLVDAATGTGWSSLNQLATEPMRACIFFMDAALNDKLVGLNTSVCKHTEGKMKPFAVSCHDK